MIALSASLASKSDEYYGYRTPTDFHLETPLHQIFSTNDRPETHLNNRRYKQRAEKGELQDAQFLRFTSPSKTPYPENDEVNACWYPASETKYFFPPK